MINMITTFKDQVGSINTSKQYKNGSANLDEGKSSKVRGETVADKIFDGDSLDRIFCAGPKLG